MNILYQTHIEMVYDPIKLDMKDIEMITTSEGLIQYQHQQMIQNYHDEGFRDSNEN